MPNRILKESICTSDNLDRLTAFQETVFYRLLVNCDDYGRCDARAKILASKLFPLKEIRASQIDDALRALTSAELVILYEVDGKPFLQMKTWNRHQTIRTKKSKYPAPTDDNICMNLQADAIRCKQMQSDASRCSRNPIQSESNPNTNTNTNTNGELRSPTRARTRFTPPTVDDVRKYCADSGYRIDAEHFVAYYESNGWRVGKNPMKDWQAAVRTWVRNGYESGGGKTSPQKKVYDDELPWTEGGAK